MDAAVAHFWPYGRRNEPDVKTIDRIQRELTQRARAERPDVQPIWDAAGEFAGLAATIRAR